MADPRHRFYVEGKLREGVTLRLPPDRSRQATRVLRLRVGDGLVLFNGRTEALGKIVEVGRDLVIVRVDEVRPGRPAPRPDIRLAMSLIKGDRFDLVVQKATELGVVQITPMETERTVLSLSTGRVDQRLARWQRIAVEAAEQSGRVDVPLIDEPTTLDELLDDIRQTPTILFWEDERTTPLARALPETLGPLLVLVGPEGGFTAAEVEAAVAAGARSASLGPLILRSETAAIAGLGAIYALVAGREPADEHDRDMRTTF